MTVEMTLEKFERGHDGRTEVRVTWKGLPEYEATWESFDALGHQFPEFHLEDKVSQWVGGGSPSLKTYVRRKFRS